MNTTKQGFIDWCKYRHDIECNQKYDGNMLYSKHLEFVWAHAERFNHLLAYNWLDIGSNTVLDCVEMACYGHDLIEDARVTYNDIVERAGKYVADLIYCCTEEKGKNREERHADKYYKELAENDTAVFIKLCDIMANVTFSILTKSSMYEKHKAENQKTLLYLYRDRYKPMFDYLNKLFDLWP